MTVDLRARATIAALAAAAAALAIAALVLLAGWPVDLRPLLADWIAARPLVPVLAALLGLTAAAAAAWSLLARPLGFVAKLTHDLEVLRSSRPELRIDAGSGVPQPLAAAINALADDYQVRRRTSEAEIERATQQLAEERDLLAAVLADLPAAVLACSRDGRVLLYTPRASELVGRVAPETFLGLGRTVFALFRRSAIVHGLDRLDAAVARGDVRPAASALLTTRGGALLHARFTPLAGRSVSGFFLQLQAVDEVAAPIEGDAAGRRHLANLRAAAEMLRDFPQMSDAERGRFVSVVDEESERLAQALGPAQAAERWPLEDIAADTLLPLLQSALQPALAEPLRLPESLPQLWVSAESFSLAALLRDYCAQLRRMQPELRFSLDLHEHGTHAQLVLRWQPACLLAPEDWRAWEQTPLSGQGVGLPLSPAAIARGHGGEIWQQTESGEAVLRIWLPRAETPQRIDGVDAALRVEYAAVAAVQTGDPPLAGLIYTVFDTETTGLDPSAGDEVIAIGGIRIVNGRILSREVFETLVATQRRIDPAAQRVHGIDAGMLANQPAIDDALPRFRAFCEETVLVGHNAAFDLRFFELQAARTGVHFDRPVLDTLLLSQLVYPQPDAHQLEAIAERLGLSPIGRHTALGDAILTAEVFLRLLPLLASRGIHTLGQALEASAKTEFARLRY